MIIATSFGPAMVTDLLTWDGRPTTVWAEAEIVIGEILHGELEGSWIDAPVKCVSVVRLN